MCVCVCVSEREIVSERDSIQIHHGGGGPNSL